jgi:hypothetical protein
MDFVALLALPGEIVSVGVGEIAQTLDILCFGGSPCQKR